MGRAAIIDRDRIRPSTPLLIRNAVAIAYPDGSFTEQDAKRAIYEGRLDYEPVGGKIFITLSDLMKMRRGATIPSGLSQMVYVVGFGSHVKIGFTTEINNRLYDLRKGVPEPLIVVSVRGGTRKDEAALHRRFAKYRSNGEWFRREGELAAWIDDGCPL